MNNESILQEELFIKNVIDRLVCGKRFESRIAIEKQMQLRGYTKKDIVEKTGINEVLLNKYMTGEYTPSKKHILKLANALEIPVEVLQNGVRADVLIGSGTLNVEQLRFLMETKGWTQAKLSRESGICEAAISKYITGTRNPTAPSLLKIANALEVSVDQLMMDAPLGNMRTSASDIMEQFVIRYRNFLSDEEKKKMIRMLMD